MPSTSTGVVGYGVYVRSSGTPYPATAVWTGNPVRAADGSISADVSYTQAATGTNYFTVVALAAASQSNIAEELPIGVTNLCRIDACTTKTTCTFTNRPDGYACDDTSFCNGPETCRSGLCDTSASRSCADAIDCTTDSCDESAGTCVHVGPPGCCAACDADDPCLADACAQGDCYASPGIELEVNRLKIVKRAAGYQLIAKARFLGDPGLDPTLTGATFELRRPDGPVLYGARIGGSVIRIGATPGRYRFVASRSESDLLSNGIERLDFRSHGSTWIVSAKASVLAIEGAFLEPQLTMMLRLGTDTCARRQRMDCHNKTALSVCR